ncbi:hypothetical protein BGX27_004096 [Mortierella sp. AM989]|nr:hypothetical protein BGX27_004096 [Mortierella sp. AM989]
MTPRRSKQIDSERVPIEYNPSQVAFVGLVGIGTPNQYFNLEFDIASSDTWVTGAFANCSRNTKCPDERAVFYPRRSSTFESEPNITWTLDLSGGQGINGTLSTDTVQVAAFVVDRQAVAVADSIDGLPDNGIDGSFGLGLRDLTFNGDPTPIENLIKAGSMRSEVGVWLGAGNQGGELIFGGRDRGRYYGDMRYYDVPKGSAYWSTSVESITVVSNKLKEGSGQRVLLRNQIDAKVAGSVSSPKVIFDTSTNIILLPPRVARDVHRYIHDYFFGFYSGYSLIYGTYTVPCSLADMDTDIWVDLGPSVPRAVDVALNTTARGPLTQSPTSKPGNKILPTPVPGPGNKYVAMAADQRTILGTEKSKTQNTRFRISGRDLVRERLPIFGSLQNICFSGIQASKSDEDDWVFGNIWFMNNYMTLDHQHRQIGVAPAVQS